MSESTGIFDAAVHPRMLSSRQIYDYLKPPYNGLVFNSPNRFFNPTPTGVAPYGEWQHQSRPDGEIVTTPSGAHEAREPGSVPARTTEFLRSTGARKAILFPMTRGLQPANDQANAIVAAYNEWLAETWLSDQVEGLSYLGTILVNPKDPAHAVKEIDKWADHPRFVQIGVTMEAHLPYGQQYYLPIWEAAAAHRLPVAVKADGGVGVEYFTTMTGTPRTHIEFSALHRDRFFFHLASFIAEGVFDRYPDLRIVFADGGFDMMTPAMWRMDMDWPITRSEVPWVKQLPSDYLRQHVRFITSRLEGPPDADADEVSEWAARTDASSLLMYGSTYPFWSSARPEQILPGLPETERERIFWGNADDLYGARVLNPTA